MLLITQAYFWRKIKMDVARSHSIKALVLFALTAISTASFAYGDGDDYKGEIPYPKEAQKMMMNFQWGESSGLRAGPYLGAQLGFNSYWVRENITLPPPSTLSGNPKINSSGWVGGLFGGYGRYFNNFYYLGGEALVNYNNAHENYFLK